MSKPYDATLKDLAGIDPGQFLADITIQYAARPARGKMDFGYEIVRLWEKRVEALLASGLISLPLAPLCRLPEGMSLEDGMRWVLTQIVERLHREGTPEMAKRLLTATFVLSGLLLKRNHVLSILQGVRAMRESDTYQFILDEGRVEALQSALLRQGRKKLGDPDEAIRNVIMNLNDLERLNFLFERMLDVSNWEELLATP